MRKEILFILLTTVLFAMLINSCDEKKADVKIEEQKSEVKVSEGKLAFAGLIWTIKKDSSLIQKNINPAFVDENGFLHLKIIKQNSVWMGCEITSDSSFGFGNFVFYTASRLDLLDKNAILSLRGVNPNALKSGDLEELGIRFSYWGSSDNKNSLQFYAKSFNTESDETKYHYPPEPLKMNGDWSTFAFLVNKEEFKFFGYHDHGFPTNYLIDNYSVNMQNAEKSEIPFSTPGNKTVVKMTLGLCEGQQPSNQKDIEIIIKKFEFIPIK